MVETVDTRLGDASSYFYAAQLESLMKQVIRIFSGFYYKTGTTVSAPMGELIPIPCKYGDGSRLAAQIIRNNSENTARTIPLFAVWIKDLSIHHERRRGPGLENKLQVTERAIDPITGRYLSTPGVTYEVDRLMPSAVHVKVQLDLISSNTSQLWQVMEQLLLIFNPTIDIQINENPLDWSALTTMELTDISYNTKSIPVGVDDSYNISSWVFSIPFHINPPAKVKRMYNVRTIITDIGQNDPNSSVDTWDASHFSEIITSAADYKINVTGNSAILLGKFGELTDHAGNIYSWQTVVNTFGDHKSSASMIRLRPGANISYATSDVYATYSIDPTEANKINLNFVQNTLPQPTIAPITDIIDPKLNFPGNGIPSNPPVGTRYLILKGIAPNTVSWGTFSAPANSIIQWNGSVWSEVFNPSIGPVGTIVQSLANFKYYVYITDGSWISAIEGTYFPGYWMLGGFPDVAF